MSRRIRISALVATVFMAGCGSSKPDARHYIVDSRDFWSQSKGVSTASIVRANELKRAAFRLAARGDAKAPIVVEVRDMYPEGTPFVRKLKASTVGASMSGTDIFGEVHVTLLRFGYRNFKDPQTTFIEVDVENEENTHLLEIEYEFLDKSKHYF